MKTISLCDCNTIHERVPPCFYISCFTYACSETPLFLAVMQRCISANDTTLCGNRPRLWPEKFAPALCEQWETCFFNWKFIYTKDRYNGWQRSGRLDIILGKGGQKAMFGLWDFVLQLFVKDPQCMLWTWNDGSNIDIKLRDSYWKNNIIPQFKHSCRLNCRIHLVQYHHVDTPGYTDASLLVRFKWYCCENIDFIRVRNIPMISVTLQHATKRAKWCVFVLCN